MPVLVEHYTDGRILRLTFTEPCGLLDLKLMAAAVQSYLAETTHKVHRLIDVSPIENIPPGILLPFRDSLILDHLNNGEFAVISSTMTGRTFVELAFRLACVTRVRFFDSADAALQFLARKVAEENGNARRNP